MNQEKYAVVFGGGGSRGAYEVGVLKAIKELDIPVGTFIGASIGALNAAFAVQGIDLEELYLKISLNDVIPNEKLNPNKDIFSIENIFIAFVGFLKSKGYSTGNLRDLINRFINLDSIYSSSIDLGIVTCTTPFTPIVAFKDEIPRQQLVDYIIASAGFPIFKRQIIDGKKCIDGGFWDNVPVNVAIKKGYQKIIAVDLSSVGSRKPTIKANDLDIISIKAPRNSLGGLFELNPDLIKSNISAGYNAAMNAFSRTTK